MNTLVKSIYRIFKFISLNLPLMLIGIGIIKYPEMITEDMKTLILGMLTIIVGARA